MRALGTPYWPSLNGLENSWQLGSVGGVVASQRNSQVKAQAEVGKVVFFAGVGKCALKLFAALHDSVGKLLVVATLTTGQAAEVFEGRGFDLLVSVTLIRLTDSPEHPIALGLLGWQEVAHASWRVHVFSHGSSLRK